MGRASDQLENSLNIRTTSSTKQGARAAALTFEYACEHTYLHASVCIYYVLKCVVQRTARSSGCLSTIRLGKFRVCIDVSTCVYLLVYRYVNSTGWFREVETGK